MGLTGIRKRNDRKILADEEPAQLRSTRHNLQRRQPGGHECTGVAYRTLVRRYELKRYFMYLSLYRFMVKLD